MRIISGKFKSKKLELPDNKTTRPLRDFVKENIFNLITHSKDIKFNFKESKVCDLFSGSGSFGLECLSRGSENVIFVEQNINVIKILKRNILKMKATTNYDVIENDVENISENYDYELKLPKSEFDDLVKTFEERQKVIVENPQDLVFYVEMNSYRYKLTRSDDERLYEVLH
mgnify:CR=1 FL=1